MATAKKKAAAKKPAAKKGRKPLARSALDKFGTARLVEAIMEGKNLTAIASLAGVSLTSLLTWMEADSERSARVREARVCSAQLWEERAEQRLNEAGDPFELSRAKELAHHYRWRAAKIAPKAYGDRTTVAGDAENPLVVQGAVTTMSEAALLAIAAGKQA